MSDLDLLLDPRRLDNMAEVLGAVLADVQRMAVQVRELRDERRLEAEEGTCDTCDAAYPLSSREGRCGDCGECGDHCPHLGKRVINRLAALAPEWVTGWEYPGYLTLRLDDTHELVTGLEGWTYAGVNEFVPNSFDPNLPGEWIGTDEVIEMQASDDPRDADFIGDVIESAALGWQEAHRG